MPFSLKINKSTDFVPYARSSCYGSSGMIGTARRRSGSCVQVQTYGQVGYVMGVSRKGQGVYGLGGIPVQAKQRPKLKVQFPSMADADRNQAEDRVTYGTKSIEPGNSGNRKVCSLGGARRSCACWGGRTTMNSGEEARQPKGKSWMLSSQ